MDIESILQDITAYQQKLSENEHISQQIKKSLVTLQQRLRAIPGPTTDEQICHEIETTYLTIDCIYNELHQNAPDPFTAPGTKDGITYEQRVDALMKRLKPYEESKILCDATLHFLTLLKQIDLSPSEEQKTVPQGSLPKEEKTERIRVLHIKKTDKSLREDTQRWLESTKHLAFLRPHTSPTLPSRKNRVPATVGPVQKRKLTSL